jgi:hypothetical protein
VSQFEEENDLGRGGGEVDEETLEDAWQTSEERTGSKRPEEVEGAD